MQKISLYCIAKVTHLSMLFTGFELLKQAGELDYTVEVDESNREGFPHPLFLLAVVDGRRIIFDMADGYGEIGTVLERCDVYFKRSFSEKRNLAYPQEQRAKMKRLGLHYHVSFPGNPMDVGLSLKKKIFQQVFNGAQPEYFIPDRFEAQPLRTSQPKVLFYTRLWDASDCRETDPAYYESVEKITADRIRLVTELKKTYANRFVGGIQFSRYAMKKCPELVVPIGATKRRNYLHTMHNAEICIASTGLHDSIGWKTAEYVAGARAIVSEHLCYEVTGDFAQGKNYLAYGTTEEALAQVEELMTHPEAVYAMQLENERYYQQYLRPDMLIRNALNAAKER